MTSASEATRGQVTLQGSVALHVFGALLLVGACLVGLAVGPVDIDPIAALWAPADDPAHVILLGARLPRVVLAALVGGALGLAGAGLQALLHNPLACPHILGISGGAALMGILAMIVAPLPFVAALGVPDRVAYAMVPVAAFVGALATAALVRGVAAGSGRITPHTLLLTGVVFNSFAAALITFINSISDFYRSHGILAWVVGTLVVRGDAWTWAAAGTLVVGLVLLAGSARDLNALALGDEGAVSLGVNVGKARRRVYLAVAVLVAGAVPVSGMIGFVGLIVPHGVRVLVGSDQRRVLPASLWGGGVFLVLADTAARTVLGATELPVGVVTALCGGPFFLLMLRRQTRRDLATVWRIDARGVTVRYGAREAVSKIDLSVVPGEVLGIIGPNGSGKSTLVRVLAGIRKPDAGTVSLEGRALHSVGRRERGRAIALVPQETHVSFPLTVRELVLLGRSPHTGSFGWESARDLEVAQRAMERTAVAALADRPIDQLSGGERQRAVLARALAQEPQVLFLDEPTSYLDLRHTVLLLDLVRALGRDEQLTVAIVLHDLNLAGMYCDRLALLSEGRLHAYGSPDEVLVYADLCAVYGTDLYVAPNDVTGQIVVLPLPDRLKGAARPSTDKGGG